MTLGEIMFWFCVVMPIYVYVGYPALAYLTSQFFGCPVRKEEVAPSVTVVIAAYNEQQVIESTVENKLTQHYAPDKLDVIVISDGSTDGTDELVLKLCTRYPNRVRLLRQEPRAGKTSALNMAITKVRGDVIVFSDANSIYAQDAIRSLVKNFADPSVGYVTGKMVYVSESDSAMGEGCSSYMHYENFLREQETAIGSVVGVDGGIDAVRKELFIPMRADQLPDFVLPLKVVSQGYRVVYEPAAILREPALRSGEDEYRMRVRVSLRALWALWDMRHLFNVFRYGLFSVQLLSHKLLRYAVFIFLLGSAAGNLFLLYENALYHYLLGAQVAFYSLAAWGFKKSGSGKHSRTGYLPYYFLLLNLASAHAFVKFILGRKLVVWEPRKG